MDKATLNAIQIRHEMAQSKACEVGTIPRQAIQAALADTLTLMGEVAALTAANAELQERVVTLQSMLDAQNQHIEKLTEGRDWLQAEIDRARIATEQAGYYATQAQSHVEEMRAIIAERLKRVKGIRLFNDSDMARAVMAELNTLTELVTAALTAQPVAQAGKPIEMILHCPACHSQHIDEGEWATRAHHKHLCAVCRARWQPSLVDTVGVERLGAEGEVSDDK